VNSADLWTTFGERLAAAGHSVAVAHATRSWTARELVAAVDSIALEVPESLEGATVVVSLKDSFALVAATLSVWRASGAVALVSPGVGSQERVAIQDGARPRVWIVSAENSGRLCRELGGSARPVQLDVGLDLDLALVTCAGEDHDRSSAALIKFSSGTTGVPKGVVLEAENVMAEAEQIRTTLSLTGSDRILAPVSLSHSYGFDVGVLGSLASGAALHLAPPLVPRRFLTEVASAEISHVLGVPALYRTLLGAGGDRPKALPSLRYLLSSTAPLQAETIIAFHARFGLPICQHYGSSEAGAVTNHVPGRVLEYPTTVGLPMNGVEIQLLAPDGAPARAGEAGAVVIRSAAAGCRYVMGGPETGTPFIQGGVTMGDLGVLQGGFLTVLGRLDNIINVGGFKVAPEEVVRALESHPAVVEAVAGGIATKSGDQAVYAAVAVAGVTTEADLIAHCGARLAEHKVPRRIDLMRQLPRGPSGKVRLPRLEDLP
jgi:acyl-coenzyme A synthetase/AMP-(fatty) acid ligase